MKSDSVLYENFLSGNYKAFDELMDKYRNNVIYFIYEFVKNIDTAEDLAQDVFVYILINKKEYDFKYTMKTYLYTIAKSRALNYLKKQKRMVLLEEKRTYDDREKYINEVEKSVFSNENKKRVHNAIKELNRIQQKVIFLACIEELSYNEVGKILGKSIPEIKMILYRARKKLKIILEKEEILNGK